MDALGYGNSFQPWIPAGIGINTGIAYVGSVHTEGGVSNITILGDSVNTTARPTSLAGVGEILVIGFVIPAFVAWLMAFKPF